MRRIMSLFVILLMMPFSFAEDFELEDIGEDYEDEEEYYEEDEEYWEEEYAEEEILVEDRAGTTPDSPFYFVDEIVEDINLAIRRGKDKAEYALSVAEEKVAEAKLMAEQNKLAETKQALTKANNVSAIIEKEVSPEVEEETKTKMANIKKLLDEIKDQIPDDWGEIESLIERQETQADKNKVVSDLVVKINSLCDKLAMQDYALMEAEPRCNPDNAPEWLKDKIEGEIQERDKEAQNMIVDVITTCINDPRECECSKIPIRSLRLDCERDSALAIECEFEGNEEACDEIDSEDEEDFLEGLLGFLQKIFKTKLSDVMDKKEKEMFEKFAPKECIERGATTREECEEIMFDIHGPPPEECLNGYGEFIGPKKCDEIMGGPPPEECMKRGKFIGRDECEEIMEEKYGKPPEECMDGREFIGDKECRDI
ncbi:MAG: DUF5667 domain-containing protein, partial [Nanoarchaeota archaeon]|nr:DUF5667 domain-containing protein [Nanoarchaeota archaeon]